MSSTTGTESWAQLSTRLKAVWEGRRPTPTDEKEEELRARSYFLIDTRGALHLVHGNLRDRYAAISEGQGSAGESGTEWTNCYPLATYYFMPVAIPETRKLNTVANGMMWELTGPLDLYRRADEDGLVDAVPAQGKRVKMKMRGPVVFHTPYGAISDWQYDLVRDAHTRAVAKLRAKGWL